MYYCDSSTDFLDNEFEHKSDSGVSIESTSSTYEESLGLPRYYSEPFLVSVIGVEFIPIHLVTSAASLTAASQWDSSESTYPSRRQLIKWTLPPPVRPAVPLPGWNPMPYGLETFWQTAFSCFFRPFLVSHGHVWTLEPTELPPLSVEWPWHSTTYQAKVRFQCQCNRGWTSMKGKVIFWFRIRRQGDQIISEVLFKLFGQQCIFCTDSSADEYEFLPPLWYPEEIENAVNFLSGQVINSYYGGVGGSLPNLEISRKRHPRGHSLVFHDSSRCQACRQGMCLTADLVAQ